MSRNRVVTRASDAMIFPRIGVGASRVRHRHRGRMPAMLSIKPEQPQPIMDATRPACLHAPAARILVIPQ